MPESRAFVYAARNGYRCGVVLSPQERERLLADTADLRYRRDRLAAALADENDDCAYRDGDVVHLNDQIVELLCRLEGRERANYDMPHGYY